MVGSKRTCCVGIEPARTRRNTLSRGSMTSSPRPDSNPIQPHPAEGEGLEPSRACASPVFETGAVIQSTLGLPFHNEGQAECYEVRAIRGAATPRAAYFSRWDGGGLILLQKSVVSVEGSFIPCGARHVTRYATIVDNRLDEYLPILHVLRRKRLASEVRRQGELVRIVGCLAGGVRSCEPTRRAPLRSPLRSAKSVCPSPPAGFSSSFIRGV